MGVAQVEAPGTSTGRMACRKAHYTYAIIGMRQGALLTPPLVCPKVLFLLLNLCGSWFTAYNKQCTLVELPRPMLLVSLFRGQYTLLAASIPGKVIDFQTDWNSIQSACPPIDRRGCVRSSSTQPALFRNSYNKFMVN